MEYKKTVVLMWNPQISSVKESDYAKWFDGLCTFNEKFFNWSVWEHERVCYGDHFILMRVGDEKAGIMMDGLISSDCFEGDDWAGTDRSWPTSLDMMIFQTKKKCSMIITSETLR